MQSWPMPSATPACWAKKTRAGQQSASSMAAFSGPVSQLAMSHRETAWLSRPTVSAGVAVCGAVGMSGCGSAHAHASSACTVCHGMACAALTGRLRRR